MVDINQDQNVALSADEMRYMTMTELLRAVDRSHPEVKELARRLEDAYAIVSEIQNKAERLHEYVSVMFYGADEE